jgi:hypothetical protein
MTDRHSDLDTALERVISAAREHLAAVQAADGRTDDDQVWRAYVELNNASFAYDELLLDEFGEVTPWDVDSIDPDEADKQFAAGVEVRKGDDAYPRVVSVRQRRDYRIPSVRGLLALADSVRRSSPRAEDEEAAPVESVGEALLELMQSGDGSLGELDIPEVESLNGVVVVAEVGAPLDPEGYADTDGSGPFQLDDGDRLVDRLDEHAYVEIDEGETEKAH